MSVMITLAVSIISLLTIIWYSTKCARRNRKGLPLPPGPKGVPILGNLLQIPRDHYWLKFDEWIRDYGPICSITLLGQPIILLGSAEVAADLLDRRSSVYSDRPRWVVASEILAKNMHVGTIRYGDRHRKLRKAIHSGLQPKSLVSYHTIEEKEARMFIKQVARDSEDISSSVKRFTASVIMGTMYGHRVEDFEDDPFARRIFSSASRFAATLAPGAFLVDIMPWLMKVPSWVPGMQWRRKADQWAEDDERLYIELLETARVNSARQPSFISEGLHDQCYGVSEKELAYIGGTISQTPDTLMSVSSVLILALTAWPDIQLKAQEEIDRVVGRSRFPVFSDRVNLPYTTAVVKETCRWRPVAPLSVPHASTKDDEYMGYFIPKGTTVISSIWSIHQDKNVYPDPDIFKPERFIDESGCEINPSESKVFGHHMYGFGRRLCPGATMADHAIWIFAVHCLWGLNIDRAVDDRDREIIPNTDPLSFTSGGEASHPLPFKCKITLRPDVEELISEIE